MIFGKNREQGSMAFTGVVAVGMIALAGMFVQNTSQQAKQSIDDAKNNRGREASTIGSDNTLARFKALLSSRKIADDKYIPAVFAKNYYELVQWNLMERPTSENKGVTTGGTRAGVTVTYQKMDSNRIAQIMNGANTAGSGDQYTIDVIRPNFQKSPGPGQYKVVESVDVNVIGVSEIENGVKKTSKVSARIPLEIPQPYDVNLRFRTAGSSAAPAPVVDGATLPSGKYEFFIFASGVVYDARLKLDNALQDPVGGFDKTTGLITHEAINYLATDKQIGQGMTIDMLSEPPPPPPVVAAPAASAGGDWAPDSFNQSTCSFVDGGGSGASASGTTGSGTAAASTPPFVPTIKKFKVQAYAFGPDGKEGNAGKSKEFNLEIESPPPPPAPLVPETPSSNGTGSGTATLSQSDYANMCAAENACTWVSTDTGNGAELGRTASYFRPAGDISSYYTFKQGQDPGKWGIFKKKVCFNFANADNSTHNLQFSEADVVTYDVTNCKRQVLFKRTTCGCVTADTEIVIEDGKTTKRIDEIVESDLIWNPLLKKAFPIRRMTVGPEKIPMIKIQIAGKEIKATGKHPFVTRNGIVPAFELEEGQEILIEDGIFAKISAIESIPVAVGETAPNVWNIELEAPNDDHAAHHMVANGITTGDLMIQMKLESGLIKK